MESLEGIDLLSFQCIHSLLNTVSIVNVHPRQEKKWLIANGETEAEVCWRGLGVCCRVLIPGLGFALPGPSVLCRGAACSLLSSAAAAL